MESALINNRPLRQLLRFVFSIKQLPADAFNIRLHKYVEELKHHPNEFNEISEAFYALLSGLFYVDSLTDAGINSNRGFFPELKQRI